MLIGGRRAKVRLKATMPRKSIISAFQHVASSIEKGKQESKIDGRSTFST
jgi:hypothetical protein